MSRGKKIREKEIRHIYSLFHFRSTTILSCVIRNAKLQTPRRYSEFQLNEVRLRQECCMSQQFILYHFLCLIFDGFSGFLLRGSVRINQKTIALSVRLGKVTDVIK